MIKTTLAVLGATLSFGPAHGAFTLGQARVTADRYEQGVQLGGRVQACRWRDNRDAICTIVADNTAVLGSGSAEYAWQDRVTRSGPCSNPGRIVSRRGGVTVQDGGHHVGNCFTGPLVAIPVRGSLVQTG